MCGRATLHTSGDELATLFGIEEPAIELTLTPRFNIAPTDPLVTVVRRSAGGARELVLQRWGLVPSWAKDASGGARMINARVESLGDKRAFRDAVRDRRCVVVVDGFYEWRKEGRRSWPHYVHRKDGRPMALAGLWDLWRPHGAGAEAIESCTIVTTPSAPPVATLHDRMPLMLEGDEVDAWLDPRIRAIGDLAALHRAPSGDAIAVYGVSSRVNRPGNDGPECIVPAEEGTRSLFG